MNEFFSDELLSAYLDGELTADEQAYVEEHLARSGELRQLLDELRAVRTSFEALPQLRLGPDFAQRVLRRAEREVLLGSANSAASTVSNDGATNDGATIASKDNGQQPADAITSPETISSPDIALPSTPAPMIAATDVTAPTIQISAGADRSSHESNPALSRRWRIMVMSAVAVAASLLITIVLPPHDEPPNDRVALNTGTPTPAKKTKDINDAPPASGPSAAPFSDNIVVNGFAGEDAESGAASDAALHDAIPGGTVRNDLRRSRLERDRAAQGVPGAEISDRSEKSGASAKDERQAGSVAEHDAYGRHAAQDGGLGSGKPDALKKSGERLGIDAEFRKAEDKLSSPAKPATSPTAADGTEKFSEQDAKAIDPRHQPRGGEPAPLNPAIKSSTAKSAVVPAAGGQHPANVAGQPTEGKRGGDQPESGLGDNSTGDSPAGGGAQVAPHAPAGRVEPGLAKRPAPVPNNVSDAAIAPEPATYDKGDKDVDAPQPNTLRGVASDGQPATPALELKLQQRGLEPIRTIGLDVDASAIREGRLDEFFAEREILLTDVDKDPRATGNASKREYSSNGIRLKEAKPQDVAAASVPKHTAAKDIAPHDSASSATAGNAKADSAQTDKLAAGDSPASRDGVPTLGRSDEQHASQGEGLERAARGGDVQIVCVEVSETRLQALLGDLAAQPQWVHLESAGEPSVGFDQFGTTTEFKQSAAPEKETPENETHNAHLDSAQPGAGQLDAARRLAEQQKSSSVTTEEGVADAARAAPAKDAPTDTRGEALKKPPTNSRANAAPADKLPETPAVAPPGSVTSKPNSGKGAVKNAPAAQPKPDTKSLATTPPKAQDDSKDKGDGKNKANADTDKDAKKGAPPLTVREQTSTAVKEDDVAADTKAVRGLGIAPARSDAQSGASSPPAAAQGNPAPSTAAARKNQDTDDKRAASATDSPGLGGNRQLRAWRWSLTPSESAPADGEAKPKPATDSSDELETTRDARPDRPLDLSEADKPQTAKLSDHAPAKAKVDGAPAPADSAGEPAPTVERGKEQKEQQVRVYFLIRVVDPTPPVAETAAPAKPATESAPAKSENAKSDIKPDKN